MYVIAPQRNIVKLSTDNYQQKTIRQILFLRKCKIAIC